MCVVAPPIQKWLCCLWSSVLFSWREVLSEKVSDLPWFFHYIVSESVCHILKLLFLVLDIIWNTLKKLRVDPGYVCVDDDYYYYYCCYYWMCLCACVHCNDWTFVKGETWGVWWSEEGGHRWVCAAEVRTSILYVLNQLLHRNHNVVTLVTGSLHCIWNQYLRIWTLATVNHFDLYRGYLQKPFLIYIGY